MNDRLEEKTISEKTIYEGIIFSVKQKKVLLPNNKEALRDMVVNPNAAAIVPIDENNNVIMVKQYRTTAEKVMLEIPAGKLDAGEVPAECAARELREETGYSAEKIEFLFAPMVSPGFSTERIHIFLATNLKPGNTDPDDDEFVETVKVPIKEVIQLIMSGEIPDSKTVSGVLAAARILKV